MYGTVWKSLTIYKIYILLACSLRYLASFLVQHGGFLGVVACAKNAGSEVCGSGILGRLAVVFLAWDVPFEIKISYKRQASISLKPQHFFDDQSLFSHRFPSNSCYHSNGNGSCSF